MADLIYAIWLPIIVAVWIIIAEDGPEPERPNWLKSTDSKCE